MWRVCDLSLEDNQSLQHYRVVHLVAEHSVDIKLKVLPQYKLHMLERNSNCKVNKKLVISQMDHPVFQSSAPFFQNTSKIDHSYNPKEIRLTCFFTRRFPG